MCYNLLASRDDTANYLVTGYWTERALTEASKFMQPQVVANAKNLAYKTVPLTSEWQINSRGRFFFYCDNETIQGLEFNDFPYDALPEGTLLVSDMTSNIGTKRIDWSKYAAVFAGVSKNLGPAGLTVLIVRSDLIPGHLEDTP
mmetsp:Transcript_22660/g.26644  ORF Transcript_22660/g.26644 Transcript_22660/m.26644 type:complete len:144 (-) Transcript_22660:494-925(-)